MNDVQRHVALAEARHAASPSRMSRRSVAGRTPEPTKRCFYGPIGDSRLDGQHRELSTRTPANRPPRNCPRRPFSPPVTMRLTRRHTPQMTKPSASVSSHGS